MVKVLLEYFTNIDEIGDFFQLWPTICNYFEITLGWHSAISGILSLIISILLIVVPIWIIRSIWKWMKTL